MLLCYPNVRLAVFNRLLLQGDCVTAMVETARDYGLNCPEDLSDIWQETESGTCGSLATARWILQNTSPEVAERLWQQVAGWTEQYKLERNQKHCRGMNVESSVINCGGMAPIVMDFLLQAIEPIRHADGETRTRLKHDKGA